MSATLAKPYDYKVDWLETTGPSSYTAGGFTVQFPRLKKIVHAVVAVEHDESAPDNYVYKIKVTKDGNTLKVKVVKLDVTASSPASWAEASDGEDLSFLKLSIVVIGE